MKILDFKDNQVVIDPHILVIGEFRDLWERDKTKDKALAFVEFGYVYHMCDFNSMYVNYPDETREEYVIKEIVRKEGWKPDKFVKAACNRYKVRNETPKQRLLRAVQNKIDGLAVFLNKTEITTDTLDDVILLINKTSPTIASADKLEEAAAKEQEKGKSHIRGNRDVALFEE